MNIAVKRGNGQNWLIEDGVRNTAVNRGIILEAFCYMYYFT